MKKNNKGFTLVELLVVIGILGVLMGVLIPQITDSMRSANLSAVGMKGHNLHVAITAAQLKADSAGRGSVWPSTQASEDANTTTDPLSGGVSSAADYFTLLFDMARIKDPATWKPYVEGLGPDVLFGASVPSLPSGATRIEGKNCMWCVAANVPDSAPDIYPVFFTRNIPVSTMKTYEKTYDGSEVEFKLGKVNGAKYDTPFGTKAYVIVRKGGSVIQQTAKYALTSVAFNKQPYTIDDDPPPQFLDVD